MSEAQDHSLRRCIRSLAAFVTIGLAGISYGVWRISAVMLTLYSDLHVSETWRQSVLKVLHTRIFFGLALAVAAAFGAACWRLTLTRAAWLAFAGVVVLTSLLVGCFGFFYWLMAFPATTMVTP